MPNDNWEHKLPSNMSDNDKKALKSAGMVFGTPVPNEYLLLYVQLPSNWKIVPTDDSNFTVLLDDRSRERAGMLYTKSSKKPFAELFCVTRYKADLDYFRLEKGEAVGLATDGDTILHRSPRFSFDVKGDKRLRMKAEDSAIKDAERWLTERFPHWKDVTLYWDTK